MFGIKTHLSMEGMMLLIIFITQYHKPGITVQTQRWARSGNCKETELVIVFRKHCNIFLYNYDPTFFVNFPQAGGNGQYGLLAKHHCPRIGILMLYF